MFRRLHSAWRWLLFNLLPPVVGVLVAVWALREVPPTEVFGIYGLSEYVPPGGDLRLRFVGKRNRACPVVSEEEIIDAHGRTFKLPPRLGNPKKDTGFFDIETTARVPDDAARGIATFHTVAHYGIDPLRGCFRSYTIGPPDRPDMRFWIGTEPPPWVSSRRNMFSPPPKKG